MMKIETYPDRATMSRAAARAGAEALRATLASKGHARLVAATGASQLDFLGALVQSTNIDWRAVEMFHLDEYVGLPVGHPASFRRYLLERLIRPSGISRYHLLDGEGDVARAVAQASEAIASDVVDVAFVGIGENGHLAFNDPPADFETTKPYLVVRLDEACRRQQVGEGWFATIDDVPSQAISMSIRQIMSAQRILCIVPDARKAAAVQACLEGPVSPMAPASVLQTHPNVAVYLDRASAAHLKPATSGPVLSGDPS
jgi:glucosamine-6-phosphate deaminase